MKKAHLFSALILSISTILSAQQPGSINGIWLGTLKLPGSELRLAITITGVEGSTPEAVLNSIDQGGVEVPMDEATLTEDTLVVSAIVLDLQIKGAVDPGSGTWVTVFTQGPAVLPLTLYKVDRLPDLSRPQEPAPPFPYKTEEVTYENSKAGITIAGTLTVPEGDGPFPAVILLTGSGPQNRDEEVFGHKPFMVLADYLTRQGIVVLRADDRGVGGTTGKFAMATTRDFADDALAGVAFLNTRAEVDPGLIGLAGHSEGGMMAPIAASTSESVGFIVLMAAPSIPFDEILLYQKKRQWEKAGMDADAMELSTKWHHEVFDLVKSDKSNPKVKKEMQKLYEQLSEEEKTKMYKSEASVEGEIELWTSPWWRFAARYDAVSTLELVTCPVLAINRSKDTQVTAKENLAVIENTLYESGNRNYFVRDIEGLNHLFQTADTGDETEYGTIEETFSPKAMDVIAGWILELEAY